MHLFYSSKSVTYSMVPANKSTSVTVTLEVIHLDMHILPAARIFPVTETPANNSKTIITRNNNFMK